MLVEKETSNGGKGLKSTDPSMDAIVDPWVGPVMRLFDELLVQGPDTQVTPLSRSPDGTELDTCEGEMVGERCQCASFRVSAPAPLHRRQ